jgi:hypothetical protein
VDGEHLWKTLGYIEMYKNIMRIGIGLGIFILSGCGHEPIPTMCIINVPKLANSIYRVENSIKYPYGIQSINTNQDKELARRICLNTIRNQIKRHNNHICNDYLTCLGKRYCPPNSKNWTRMVRYYYELQK